MADIRVRVLDQSLTLAQWREVQASVTQQIDAYRAKCPTCRCMILPGASCGCCWDIDVGDEASEHKSAAKGEP